MHEQPVKRIGLPPHIDPKFQLFTVPPIDETVASRRIVEIPPLVTGQINPIEFEIKPMLKQVSVYINGVLTTVQSDTYALSAMIQTILNHDENDAKSILRPQGFMPDNLNVPNPFTANKMNIAANAGAGHADFQNLPMRQQAAVRAMVEEKNCTRAECVARWSSNPWWKSFICEDPCHPTLAC